MKWWRVGLIACAGIALAIYGYEVRTVWIPESRWMIGPPVIAAIAAMLGSRWRQRGDRVAWIAIAGSCAMTAASYALTMWQSAFGSSDASASITQTTSLVAASRPAWQAGP